MTPEATALAEVVQWKFDEGLLDWFSPMDLAVQPGWRPKHPCLTKASPPPQRLTYIQNVTAEDVDCEHTSRVWQVVVSRGTGGRIWTFYWMMPFPGEAAMYCSVDPESPDAKHYLACREYALRTALATPSLY